MALNRQSRQEAEFKAFLRAKRSYEKRMADIEWTYEEFYPLLEKFQAGHLSVEGGSPFAIEASADDVSD